MRRLVIAAAVVVVGVAIALGCARDGRAESAPGKQIWRDGSTPLPAALVVPSANSLAPLVKAVKPAVVNISSTTVVKNPHPGLRVPGGDDSEEPDFFQFFGPRMPREFRGQSLGSGFIINADGYVLTNNHVVQNATDIKVRLADAREFEAKVVGRDASTDVAVIKLEKASGLPTVGLGDSDALEQGDYVLALGSPFGFRESVTFGIVSAKDRTLNTGNPFDDFIQTDAAINQGNSGGPLFNMKGEVVGINTAIISPQIGQGLGFAVPINMAKNLIPQLLEKGKVARGYLGVSVSDLSPDLAQGFGVAPDTKGALVQNVLPDSPAAKAGVQAGDIVLGVNGKKVDGSGQLTRAVASVRPGGKVALEVLRKGQKKDLTAVVAQRPDEERLARGGEEEEPGVGGDKKKDEKLGIQVADLTPEMARELRVQGDGGVVVVGVSDDGPAARAGIRRRDLILEVNLKPVSKVADLQGAIAKAKPGEVVNLRIRRGEEARFVPVKIGGDAKKEQKKAG